MSFASLRNISFFLLNLLSSTIGMIFCSTLMFYAIKPVLTRLHLDVLVNHDFGLVLPLFPYQCMVAFCVGFWITRKFEFARTIAVRWVWVIPAIWFVLLCAGSSSSCWQHFVWSMDPRDKRVQLLSTLPFLTSMCYALGNLLAIKTSRRHTDVLAD